MAFQHRIRNVTAVLGPTNTGKTHLAIERMLGHSSGMIGLPLRLLAREVYDKIVARVGPSAVALVTGEEKIKPDNPRYWVSTVEAMPRSLDVDFLAIDEIQLAADPDRGHVFTDRMLHARGRSETLLLGASTMRDAIAELIPDANFISRPRLSKISWAGQKKITRLPKRTAIVAFSAAEVYSIAELIRRQLGGAAVVLGALSPRTRNAQVALYQSGDVDYLVATDAIGMGLNLDVDHVAFAAVRKFDGHVTRNLTAGELAQIAGRAGRHVNDGTFGVTGDAEPFDPDLIERLESHNFDPVRLLQWRNTNLDFSSLERLRESLRKTPTELRLQRVRMADDVTALETLAAASEIAARAVGADAVSKLWDVCQVPDYRKISSQNHAELVAQLYGFLMSDDQLIPEDWFAKQVAFADRTDGDIDTLATRIAHIRTWTFVSNRVEWLKDPVHWQQRTRAIEDSLSDALHEQLALRFVDRKTSALMKGLRDKDDMSADIGADGAITVENHFVGRLKGFRFWPDAQADATGVHGKTARSAAAHVVSKELAMRARRVASAKTDAFKLARNGRILWRDEEIARLESGDDPLRPIVVVLADDHLTAPDKEKIQQRLDAWMTEIVAERLKPLVEIKAAEDISGLARGIAFRLVENFGIVKRDAIAEEMRQLDQPSRAQLRKYGVRFGAFNIFLPPLLKPAPAELTLALWTLTKGTSAGLALEQLPEPPRAGLTSVVVDPAVPEDFYRAAGYHGCGPRAIRVDMLERLADSIRPLLAWRPSETNQTPPRGSSGDGAFMVTPEMMSILGCSSAELGAVLSTLGFRSEKRPAPKLRPQGSAAKSTTAPAGDVPAASEVSNASIPDASDGDLMEPATADAAPEAVATAAATTVTEPAVETSAATDPVGEAAVTVAPLEVSEPAAETSAPTSAQVPADLLATAGSEPADPSAADAASPTPAAAIAADTAVATATEPAAEVVTAETAAAEVPMIDVWRPRRRGREDYQRPRRDEGRPQGQHKGRRPGEAVVAGEPARAEGDAPRRDGDRGPNRGRDRNRNRGDRNRAPGGPDQATTPIAAAPAEAGATPSAPTADAPRLADGPRRDGERDRRDGQGERGARSGGGDRSSGDRGGRGSGDRDRRPGGGSRDDRRDNPRSREDRGGGGSRPLQRTATPQRKGGIDPDSPFAALSALKLQLEKQGKTPS